MASSGPAAAGSKDFFARLIKARAPEGIPERSLSATYGKAKAAGRLPALPPRLFNREDAGHVRMKATEILDRSGLFQNQRFLAVDRQLHVPLAGFCRRRLRDELGVSPLVRLACPGGRLRRLERRR